MFKSSALILLLTLSVANCQFFYNYEENNPEEPKPETQSYDQSAYQYNPPSAVNQQYLQSPSTEIQPENEGGNRRTRIRIRSRNYQSEPDYNEPQQMQFAPAVDSNVDQRAIRQERRQARRRQRQNDYLTEPVVPPRMYGPSIFDNIQLGEAPSGIYIPQNSFLNVLRNSPSQSSRTPSLISQPISTVPQTTSYIQPSVDYANSRTQSPFFVGPPSNEEPRQQNLILPITRPAVEYAVPQTRVIPSRNSARSVRGNRRTRPRMRIQAERAAPPTVDIDALRESSDDISRENVMSQVQYIPPVNNRQNSKSQNRRRTDTNYQQTTPAPRVYSPSIFETVGLGEAPSGVYVPEDSLLNSLRNPSRPYASSRVSRQELPILSEPESAYSVPNEYGAEIVEEQYQQSPPPPPPRRSSSQRSRQAATSRRSQAQEYQNENEDYQYVQPTSQRRSQRRGNDYEDFERQTPPVRHRTQPEIRPAAAPVSRTQSQFETSQSTFKKAKLAIAELPQDTDDDGIPGEAGVNYPTLHTIPETSFSCSQQSYNGYYADLETSCQVFHLCQSGGVQSSFLCSNGTIFSQEKFSCQWWYKVNCNDAPKFYIKNEELYKVPEKRERKRN